MKYGDKVKRDYLSSREAVSPAVEKRLKSMVVPPNSLRDDLMGLCNRLLDRVKCQPNAQHLAVASYNNLKEIPVFV